ncbi:Hsp20 family protein [Candidatus Steffania adelgidicola]|uniref:Hsp20 family protein n=1 Tax=Candidatus Steffania adelgidicola TaxID=1076626 RepID=UPI001D021C53|nr:Hsp20 family protein [Candidatus Steffania adelgidicola]UDG79745.1 Small heat shock protein IbpB [Candidatus Steffania adelgidicola]
MADTPTYNVLKKDKEHYEVRVSVPGYTQDEIDISLLNHQLTISDKPKIEKKASTKEKDNLQWLHEGMKKSEFSLNFNLEHRIKIQQVNLDNGLLILLFTYDIPAQEQPPKISIITTNKSDGVLKYNGD